VALAGAIVAGLARSIVTLSAHAELLGVGATGVVWSRLVVTSGVTSGWIAPGGGLAGISGVDSGRAAPLVGGPPGVELHTAVAEPPTGGGGDMVPVVLPMMNVGMVPNGVDDTAVVDGVTAVVPPAMLDATDGVGAVGTVMEGGARAGGAGGGGAGTVELGKSVMNDVAGCTDTVKKGAVPLVVVDAAELAGAVGAAATVGIVPVVPPMADMEVTGTAGVPGAICPVGMEQVTTVPGVVGLEASGTGASVVPGAPGWVAAENGLGPLSAEVTIAPGVDGRPMAVVPIVETWARLAWQPTNSRATTVNSKCRIAIAFSRLS
jgi:hypothetical protein